MANPKEPPSTSLTAVNTFNFNTRAVPFVYRNRYKTVSYACSGMIISWNWETGCQTEIPTPITEGDQITVIEELRNGKLVFGTKNGDLYLQTRYSWLYICNRHLMGSVAVARLLAAGPAHIFLKSSDGDKILINTYTMERNKLSRQMLITFYRVDIFACFSGTKAETKSVMDLSKALHSVTNPKGFCDMRAERGQFVLLQHQDKTQFTIWDVENVRFLEAPLNPAIHTNQFLTLVIVNYTTFIVPDWDGSVFLKRLSYKEQRGMWYSSRSESAGLWEVTSMVYAGGCVMYATIPAGSGIHAFDENLNLLYSGQELTHDGWGRPLAMEAVGNGYVAIQFNGAVQIVKRRKYNKRLLIGEGDFSYTEALINKHPHLARAIVATELKDRDEVDEEDRLAELESSGVELLFGVDVQYLHRYDRFSATRFKRIHWNCPYGDSAYSMSKGAFKSVIVNFFNSCSRIQRVGDRVYVTLMQERDYWITRQKENPIVLGSVEGGYILIAKRVFGSERYPGYEHRRTSGWPYYSDYHDEMREFVFKKVSRKARTYRKYNVYQPEYSADGYFDCDTDGDSSCYEDSSDDE